MKSIAKWVLIAAFVTANSFATDLLPLMGLHPTVIVRIGFLVVSTAVAAAILFAMDGKLRRNQ
jgi:hypothetical protein